MRSWSVCFSYIMLKITMSSRRRSVNCHLKLERVVSIARWNMLGTFCKAKSMRMKRYKSCCDVTTVMSLLASSILICQYLLLAFTVENTFASPCESIHLSIRGNGDEFCLDAAFSLRMCIRFWSIPSFLGKNKIAAAHSDCTGLVMFLASILSNSALPNYQVTGPARNCSERNDVVSGRRSSIWCFATLRRPWLTFHN